MRVVKLLLYALPLVNTVAAQEVFVLLRPSSGELEVQGGARAGLALTPCSTFKIANSLIALESGVVPDPGFVLDYDPKRDGEQFGAWNRNLDLASALRESAVWYYRETARRVGAERMQAFLNRFEYGNRSLNPAIDRFWVGGDLRITAAEQVRFLQRFYRDELGISRKTRDLVHGLLELEAGPDYRWYGKTGTCTDSAAGTVGWHVGFVERSPGVSFYAFHFNGGTVGELAARRPARVRAHLAAAGLIPPQEPSAEAQMKARTDALIAKFPGQVSFFARNLDTGESYGLRETERVRTASTIKLAVLAGAFAAVEAGNASWSDPIELRAEDKVSGSGVLTEFSPDARFPLRDLANLMIVVSDNTATNLVLDRIGTDWVNQVMDRLGLRDTRVLRKVLMGGQPSGVSKAGQMPELQKYGLGVTTPFEMVRLLEKTAGGEVVSPDASRAMLEILGRQQYKDGIGRILPGARVTSKSGTLDRLRSDVGIVESPGGRIALAVTVDGLLRTDYSPENPALSLISGITQIVSKGLSAPVANLGPPEKTIELKTETGHVQGIEVEGDRLWVTWVDTARKTGHLGEFSLATGKLVRSVELQEGERYHPGGITGDQGSLWVPVAEYRPGSSSVIQRRSKKTLEIEHKFEVADHIGCLARAGEHIYGGNWDARTVYEWTTEGKLVSQRGNPQPTHYQDWKTVGGLLIGAGQWYGEGAIDWLRLPDLKLVKRLRTGKSSRGVLLTNEGMTIQGGKLYLLPEDGQSRLFVFPLSD